MSIFEERGVSYQFNAKSVAQANKAFATSCDICCKCGKHISCDRCAISVAHQTVLEVHSR